MSAQLSFLPESYPEGFHVLRGYVGASQQEQIYRLTRQLAKVAPFVTPRMPNGAAFRLEVSSWGPAGWFADGIGYAYLRFHPVTKKPWPMIPDFNSCVSPTLAKRRGI